MSDNVTLYFARGGGLNSPRRRADDERLKIFRIFLRQALSAGPEPLTEHLRKPETEQASTLLHAAHPRPDQGCGRPKPIAASSLDGRGPGAARAQERRRISR